MKSVPLASRLCGAVVSLVVLSFAASAADLAENVTNELGSAEWIWSPAHQQNEIPAGNCFFRKSFDLSEPEEGEVQFTADNKCEVYVNGQHVGGGTDWRRFQVIPITEYLVPGRNCVAFRVTNIDEGTAGLAGRVLVKEKSGTYANHPTNSSWRSSVREYADWTIPQFSDSEWVAAASFGLLGEALPWGDEVVIAGVGARFNIGKGFTIERLMRDEEVGSLIAMAFNHAGDILASREGGNLMLLTDSDDNGTPDTVGVYCDKIKNVQGILPLGTRVFAIGDGPEGVALYRMRDADRDGVAEEIQALIPIRGSRGEHGAHAVRLGPDGFIYVIVGDHARVGKEPAPTSTYRHVYEGDLVQPRFQDPRGHAVGIPAPGGTIFRTDAEGSFVELVAGGLRNSYDFAFSPQGELFTYDSDMEWDMGAPWYRPTRVNHATEGAELGWRSGWAKWPEYYLDSLPSAIALGAGSPTGVEFYEHHMFPKKYHGAMFGCDWATGQIYCIRFHKAGASYRGQSEVFVAGRPLNATDIAVGPDGALYFCTGGRGTDGGVYRIRWTGEPSEIYPADEQWLEAALHQPQIESDWARARVATLKNSMGASWNSQLEKVALDPQRDVAERHRALSLMVYFGPRPSEQLLNKLASDPDANLRTQVARLMFANRSVACRAKLVKLLADGDAGVRRVACESLMRQGAEIPLAALMPLLADDDDFVGFAARRALETQPVADWAQAILNAENTKTFARGSVALLAVTRDPRAATAVISRCQSLLQQPNVEQPEELIDLLRVAQLAFELGKVSIEPYAGLGNALLATYPTEIPAVDRELVRLLVHLQVPGAADKLAAQVAAEISAADKLHIAAYASRLNVGWSINSKLALMGYMEKARSVRGGYSVSAYVENFAREFFEKFSLAERQQVLAVGERWPTSSLSVLAKLPPQPPAELLATLRELDGRIQPKCADDDAFRRLRVGIIAVLGRSGETASSEYLRQIYDTSPADRHTVAMSMTQHPEGENWSYLVDSLKTVDGRVAQEILSSLAKVAQRPQEPEAYRQVILQGLRLRKEGGALALALLDHWVGRQPAAEYPECESLLGQWQQWYAKNFPAAPPAELPADVATDKWSYEELLSFLENGSKHSPNLEQGRLAFQQAQCVKCHRCNGFGETIGPDLTSVASRFQKKEILESIVYPSHNVSDQYASQVVIANGKTYAGLVVPRGEIGVSVLLPEGEVVQIAQADIESINPSATSAMPNGLLNALSLEQVGYLFDYLEQGGRGELAARPGTQRR